jgi:hypothetical protein
MSDPCGLSFRHLTTDEERDFYREQELTDQRLGKGPEPGKWWMRCPKCTVRSMSGRQRPCDCDEGWVIVDEYGLLPPCTVEDHTWVLEFDAGSYHVSCKNPHTPIEIEAMYRYSQQDASMGNWRYPVCGDDVGDYVHTGIAGEIEVKLNHVDDSTPSTPAGPAEYGYYLEITEARVG